MPSLVHIIVRWLARAAMLVGHRAKTLANSEPGERTRADRRQIAPNPNVGVVCEATARPPAAAPQEVPVLALDAGRQPGAISGNADGSEQQPAAGPGSKEAATSSAAAEESTDHANAESLTADLDSIPAYLPPTDASPSGGDHVAGSGTGVPTQAGPKAPVNGRISTTSHSFSPPPLPKQPVVAGRELPPSAQIPVDAAAPETSTEPEVPHTDEPNQEQAAAVHAGPASTSEAGAASGETAQNPARIGTLPGELATGAGQLLETGGSGPEHNPALEETELGAMLPGKYRAQLRAGSGKTRRQRKHASTAIVRTRPLDAELVLMFEPGDWGISLLAALRRPDEEALAAAVRIGDGYRNLLAVDEGFFEPFELGNPSDALSDGIAFSGEASGRTTWIRSGRKLHVFSGRPGLPGLVSVSRAVIGEENAILCEDSEEAEVRICCEAAGSGPLLEVGGPGVPAGYKCFRGYWPTRVSARTAAEEIFDALAPHPDADIVFSGGIHMGLRKWAADRPPSIRIIGQQPADGEVTIDGAASSGGGGSWTAPGWDTPGEHVVRFAGISRKYELAEPADEWERWSAHPGRSRNACGASIADSRGAHIIALPSDIWTVAGASPGEIAEAASAAGCAVAAPAFAPVWIVRHRRRGRPMALLLAGVPPSLSKKAGRTAMRAWARLVRSASPEGGDEVKLLWREYRRLACRIGRSTR